MTRTRGTTRSRKDVAPALLLAGTLCGCDLGSPASPTFEGGVTETTPEASLDGGDDGDGDATMTSYAVCPQGIDASFGSIYGEMLSTSGCGTDRKLNCHSTSGAAPQGTGNGLDFSEGGAFAYKELINVPAVNLAGNAHVIRVVPGDASASFLYIKLTLTTSVNNAYGAGMPLDTPGSVCPAALDAVKTWIDQGAPQN
jgi:hypothetical protein